MHATEVKVVLASVVTALAIYQLVLAAVGYRKLRVTSSSRTAPSTPSREARSSLWRQSSSSTPTSAQDRREDR